MTDDRGVHKMLELDFWIFSPKSPKILAHKHGGTKELHNLIAIHQHVAKTDNKASPGRSRGDYRLVRNVCDSDLLLI